MLHGPHGSSWNCCRCICVISVICDRSERLVWKFEVTAKCMLSAVATVIITDKTDSEGFRVYTYVSLQTSELFSSMRYKADRSQFSLTHIKIRIKTKTKQAAYGLRRSANIWGNWSLGNIVWGKFGGLGVKFPAEVFFHISRMKRLRRISWTGNVPDLGEISGREFFRGKFWGLSGE